MSMLAEPRRKTKYSIDPRGNSWSKDDSKFGQKLLEKFGWTKGKGLGANEDGDTEHVKIAFKNDSRGVGCSKNHADNWIAHQDDFNSLLSDLNQNTTGENKTTVISLEEKSKQSKSRVHYQKFTKGKDLSGKSSEDMDCIFGKRKSVETKCATQEADQTSSSSDSEGEPQSHHGLITIKSTDSIQEYFAKKMAEKKLQAVSMKESSSEKEGEEKSEKKSYNMMAFSYTSETSSTTDCDSSNNTGNNRTSKMKADEVKDKQDKPRKEKKKKKCKELDITSECTDEHDESNSTKKKSKKGRRKDLSNEDILTEEKVDIEKNAEDILACDHTEEKENQTKKTKKRKLKGECESSDMQESEKDVSSNKKRKLKGECESSDRQESDKDVSSNKKRKAIETELDNSSDVKIKKPKSKKKEKKSQKSSPTNKETQETKETKLDVEEESTATDNTATSETELSKKAKKRKNKKDKKKGDADKKKKLPPQTELEKKIINAFDGSNLSVVKGYPLADRQKIKDAVITKTKQLKKAAKNKKKRNAKKLKHKNKEQK